MISMKILVLLCMVFLTITLNVSAQEEKEVCVVYFTAINCDDCGLADNFMDGLINEYSETLTAIKYTVDSSQENRNVFEAYRNTYGLPSQTPLILFGENDYLLGISEIYKNAEPKIYSLTISNGTNCPLESGYVPPGQLNPGELSGQPEVFETEKKYEEGEEEGKGKEGEIPVKNETENKTTPIPSVLPALQEIYEENFYPISLIVFLVIVIAVTILMMSKKKSRKKGKKPKKKR